MKCGNCRAFNGHVFYIEEEKWVLCPRCLSILKDLNHEYFSIVGKSLVIGSGVSVDEQTSSGHIVNEHAE